MVQSFLNHIPLRLFVELFNVFPKIILPYLVPCIIFLWIESGKVLLTYPMQNFIIQNLKNYYSTFFR